MKLNQKGFSLLEIMAVLVIFSLLLFPLTSSFSDAYARNQRSQRRRIATGIASGTIYGLDKIDFSEYRGLLDTANGNFDYYLELNENNCSELSVESEPLCDQLFSSIWSSSTYDAATYKVYMFNYHISTNERDDIINNGSIKPSVRDLFDSVTGDDDILSNISDADTPTLIRVVVWVEYNTNPKLDITLTGLIVDD